MKSFKQMIQAGELKRADAMKIALDDIHEEPGFNLRVEGEDLDASIENLALHILAGGMVPPLEVRVREAGGVFVVDGHRRRRAFLLARERGAPVEFISIVAFTGNDADRVARIITSAEGRGLSPLETSLGYKRLAAFGKTADEIAAMVGKTRQHVDQLLTLANANSDVHAAVKDGKISAAGAVGMVRKHGEGAGAEIADQLDKAKAQGKGKVTAGTVKPKALPVAVVDGVVKAADALLDSLTEREHSELSSIRNGSTATNSSIMVSGSALLLPLDAHTAAVEARNEQRAKAAAKVAKASQKDLVPA